MASLPFFFQLCLGREKDLLVVWDINFSFNQKIPRDENDALIRPAAGGRRQFVDGFLCDVDADYGEVAVRQFPDVGTTAAADGLRSVLMRVFPDPAAKFDGQVHIVPTIGEVHKIGKDKITHISGFYAADFRLSLWVVRLLHRRIIGQNIRTYRKQKGWSQEVLAEKAGLTYKYLGEVERADVNVSADSLMRIAKSMKVKLGDLVQGV
jgi:DNA-binding XRE family transcriptional regulator